MFIFLFYFILFVNLRDHLSFQDLLDQKYNVNEYILRSHLCYAANFYFP